MRTTLKHWQRLWSGLDLAGDCAAWHQRLIDAYAEPQRAYHTLQHLEECLLFFDEVKAGEWMKQPDLIETALWFHDAVYDPKSGENEALSAKMAAEALGGSEATREITRMIMLTKSHEPGSGLDDAWIIDIDLAIFAQPMKRVIEYERQIRQEYAWVPEAVYREKRVEILAGFQTRERIYLTHHFHERCARIARQNLAELIAQLRQ